MSKAVHLQDRLGDMPLGDLRNIAWQIWSSFRVPTERQISDVLEPFFSRYGIAEAKQQKYLVNAARRRLNQYIVCEAELGGTHYLYADTSVHVMPGMSRKNIEKAFLAARTRARRKKQNK